NDFKNMRSHARVIHMLFKFLDMRFQLLFAASVGAQKTFIRFQGAIGLSGSGEIIGFSRTNRSGSFSQKRADTAVISRVNHRTSNSRVIVSTNGSLAVSSPATA